MWKGQVKHLEGASAEKIWDNLNIKMKNNISSKF